jgi:hypothetical protein
MGRQAAEAARERFSADIIVSQYEAYYDKIYKQTEVT